jgi:hypothetical protein
MPHTYRGIATIGAGNGQNRRFVGLIVAQCHMDPGGIAPQPEQKQASGR